MIKEVCNPFYLCSQSQRSLCWKTAFTFGQGQRGRPGNGASSIHAAVNPVNLLLFFAYSVWVSIPHRLITVVNPCMKVFTL
jgi:hypothetical protein